MSTETTTLYRRDFLKIGALVATIPFVPILEPVIERLRLPQTAIEIAIFDELGLTPEQITVTLFPGEHVFGNEIINRIHSMTETGGKVIVTGELIPLFLANVLGDSLAKNKKSTQDACQPGIGSTITQQLSNVETSQELVREGVNIVTSDGDPGIFKRIFHLPAEILEMRVALISIGVLTVAAGGVVAFNLKKAEEEGFRITRANAPILGVILGSVSLATYLYSKSVADCGNQPESKNSEPTVQPKLGIRNREFEDYVRGQIEFEKMFVESPDGVFGYYEALVRVRNLMMTLHLWRVAAMSVEVGESNASEFVAYGTGHGQIEDEFVKGISYVQGELTIYMKRIIEYGKRLNKSKNEVIEVDVADGKFDDKESQAALYDWFSKLGSLTDYIRFFQETVSVGDSGFFLPRPMAASYCPPSARALMFREIMSEINIPETDEPKTSLERLTSKRELFKSAAMKALALDGENERRLLNSKEKLTGTSREELVIGEIDLEAEKVLWFDQGMRVSLGLDSYSIEGKLIVGCVEVGGRMCPITREFEETPELLYGIDKVLLGNDQVVKGKKVYRYSTIAPVQPEKDNSVTISLIYIDGRQIVTNLGIFDPTTQELNYRGITKIYWLQDNNIDPAMVNTIGIK